LTEIDIRWVGNSDIQLKNGRLSPLIEHAREKIEAFELELSARAPGKRKRQESRKKRAN
jgi:hypothetical protein